MNYLFILGNHPVLSIAEIKSLFNFLGIKTSFFSVTPKILQVNTFHVLEQDFIDQLGGTTKIAKVVGINNRLDGKEISKLLAAINEKRINFGISTYGFQLSRREYLSLCKNIKQHLLPNNTRINYFFPQRGNELSSVVVQKKIFAKGGKEVIIVKAKDRFILGQTLQIQDFEKYSLLDYGIPCPDPKSGMLPPKLAQMMINLVLPYRGGDTLSSKQSVEKRSVVVYDPFCGCGRIILQALSAGFFRVYGSDIDQRAVRSSQENIKWLINTLKLGLPESFAQKNIFVQDATQKNKLPANSADTIVTEPHLGPPYKKPPESAQIKQSFAKLESLYLNSFRQFAPLLKDGAKIACIFPIINEQALLNNLVDKFSSLGYHKLASFIYSRSYQIVKREIVLFKFQNPNVKFPINAK